MFYRFAYVAVSLEEPPPRGGYHEGFSVMGFDTYWVNDLPQWELIQSEDGQWYHISKMLKCVAVLRTKEDAIEDFHELARLINPNRFQIRKYEAD